jgi:hypothetical protein
MSCPAREAYSRLVLAVASAIDKAQFVAQLRFINYPEAFTWCMYVESELEDQGSV